MKYFRLSNCIFNGKGWWHSHESNEVQWYNWSLVVYFRANLEHPNGVGIHYLRQNIQYMANGIVFGRNKKRVCYASTVSLCVLRIDSKPIYLTSWWTIYSSWGFWSKLFRIGSPAGMVYNYIGRYRPLIWYILRLLTIMFHLISMIHEMCIRDRCNKG